MRNQQFFQLTLSLFTGRSRKIFLQTLHSNYKKSVKLLFPALFLSGMLFFYGCDQKADLEGDDKNTGSYSRVVETIDFALSTGCRWISFHST